MKSNITGHLQVLLEIYLHFRLRSLNLHISLLDGPSPAGSVRGVSYPPSWCISCQSFARDLRWKFTTFFESSCDVPRLATHSVVHQCSCWVPCPAVAMTIIFLLKAFTTRKIVSRILIGLLSSILESLSQILCQWLAKKKNMIGDWLGNGWGCLEHWDWEL